jgi:hypothetical protein
MSVKEIAEKLPDLKHENVRNMLGRMADDKEISSPAHGFYESLGKGLI